MCANYAEFINYASGIYSGPANMNGSLRCDGKSINFSALLVGFGTDNITNIDYWIVKNSFGTQWGIQGYMYVQRGLGLLRYPSYPNVSN